MKLVWQKGPSFLQLSESQWPIKQKCPVVDLPEQAKMVMAADIHVEQDLADRIDINCFSSYTKLLRVTSCVLATYKREPVAAFWNVRHMPSAEDLEKAEDFWIRIAQSDIMSKIKQGELKRLCPRVRENNVSVVGNRAEKWMEMSYNKRELIILPFNHRFSRLYAKHIHQMGHLCIAATLSKKQVKILDSQFRTDGQINQKSLCEMQDQCKKLPDASDGSTSSRKIKTSTSMAQHFP